MLICYSPAILLHNCLGCEFDIDNNIENDVIVLLGDICNSEWLPSSVPAPAQVDWVSYILVSATVEAT